ncbi:MAG TPA: ABC transporter permease [Vicinamibacterales bacterium]
MIPLKYSTANLRARRMATAMTVAGIGVVIAVMLAMLALDRGVRSQLTASGSPDLLLVMRDGADAELSSQVTKEALAIIGTLPGVAKASDGAPLVAPQFVSLFKLPKRDSAKKANVTVRGVTPTMFLLRPYVRIIEGRVFRPGVNEVIVSRRIRDRFAGMNVGDSFRFGPRTWVVTGVFDAEGTAFDSEMWCDIGYLMQVRKREAVSSVLVKPAGRHAFQSVAAAVHDDPRLQLQAKSERQYYADQTQGLNGIKRLVQIVAFFMVGAAIFGTMNTMFSAIAARGRELATLRALGFRRRSILLSVMIESAAIALLGGIAGVLFALPVNFISTGTFNGMTMSEVAFNFRVDGGVAAIGIVTALAAGIAGGLLPALRAATLPITRALREI